MSSAPNHVETFLREAEDLLTDIEQTALALDPAHPVEEELHRLFRAFHTLKGSGAMFGFDAVAAFTHHVETVLDRTRSGALPLSSDLRRLLLASHDHIAALLAAAGSAAPAPTSEQESKLVAALCALIDATPVSAIAPAPTAPAAPPERTGHYRILFRPAAEIMLSGCDPQTLLDELRTFGECQVVADLAAVPALEALPPTHCLLAWTVDLRTTRPTEAIRDVFIFVEDGSEISIAQLEEATPAPTTPAPRAPTAAPATPATPTAPTPPARRPAAARDNSVRVSSERLDRLVALVGELVINQSRLSQVSHRIADVELAAPVEEFERLVHELRESVLGIRMMPIGTTFGRFTRLVHDLSAELDKQVDLITDGADTELDKAVLDQLGEPLVHLIRNSLDHGIEPAAARLATGKPPRGTLRLSAAHTGSNVALTIADDGRGLDESAIRAKAIERGIIDPNVPLSTQDIYKLIFLPGFSTAQSVTKVSGRGVGMDVVRRQIESLRGTIALDSTPGRGTTITLTLPLTLAIIEGLVVEVAGDRFILPMASVLETVEISVDEHARHNGRCALPLRGELVPYFRLREVFRCDPRGPALEKIVVVRHGADRLGFVVDRVLGSHQTVIQSLGRVYRGVEIASGATIMGDGRVALILDLDGIARAAAAPHLAS